ncbi:MAG: NUDIX hydrolase [Lactobacillus sp.]|jgi:ADP-ribose pyrophosphatase YjhB (NUDIX family)|uniref:NUDIX hydrolase n=1 Tax=Lacticaseibacillus suilingensis TaxID=2799577 RepID=A0ABW4BEQ7_9LACO|nr:NUDIX hydrolase [Lacticaseibacillus suilingensis]MCI1893819.1 NUDIX hydrolase [Lactobacillus sp.]MCI1941674.1 NUDIX hydrolase [Lactobacillus sp.]MCI1972220.1 NUDIX hydrolase [Lactobacillus sp.]MCI2017363.1 NUDIX hydrolase [Lactobacillus sp.]MCI2036768.1 NUDIX hydrolase [Lactobacillus sp.]
MVDYIKTLRGSVGHQPIILNFSGGILMNNRHEILLQRRQDFHEWGLPGGALELGETVTQACQREFREETGLEVGIKRMLGISSSGLQHYVNGDVAQAIVTFFEVSWFSGELNPDNDETTALQFFNQHQLPDIFSPQHEVIISHFFADLERGQATVYYD